jgi:hypothetical protein
MVIFWKIYLPLLWLTFHFYIFYDIRILPFIIIFFFYNFLLYSILLFWDEHLTTLYENFFILIFILKHFILVRIFINKHFVPLWIFIPNHFTWVFWYEYSYLNALHECYGMNIHTYTFCINVPINLSFKIQMQVAF